MSSRSAAGPPTVGPVLVINSGSSSLKYQLVLPDSGEVRGSGLIERIGEDGGRVRHTGDGSTYTRESPITDHRAALTVLSEQFAEHGPDLGDAEMLEELATAGVPDEMCKAIAQLVAPYGAVNVNIDRKV